MTEAEDSVDPASVVADAAVLAADLLVGDDARTALDHVRRHSWMTLLASDELLADAQAVIVALADTSLAADWYQHIDELRTPVSHPSQDHPALATAYRGNAAHLLSFDDGLTSASANLSMQAHMDLSVRSPTAFARLFDPEPLYESLHNDEYPGPDRDPRA